MSGKIVNLRQIRKRQQREKDSHAAAENRALYGRPKADRDLDKAEAHRARSVHEGHKLEKNPPEESI